MRVSCLLASAILVAVAAPSASEPEWPGIYLPNPASQNALHWALKGASDWLAKPACREVFTEFNDQAGKPLDRKLAQLSVNEAQYLRSILFRDGSALRACDGAAIVMFTTPGSRVVFVCERQLHDLLNQNKTRLNALVIHEALHTLGLGENPPTSKEITARVIDRCWR